MILHFAFDMEQYDRLVTGSFTGPSTVAVMEPGIALRAERDGHRAIDLWSYLGTEDIRDSYALLGTLAGQWWCRDFGSVQHRDIALTETAHRDMWFAISAMELGRRAVERVLDALSPESLVVCEPRGQAVFWDVIPVAPGCLPAGVALAVAEERNLSVSVIATADPVLTSTPAESNFDLLQRLEHQFVEAEGKNVFCLFLGELEYRRHGVELERLAQETGRFAFLLKASGDFSSSGQSAAEAVWYDLLACFPETPGLRRSLNESWQAFVSRPCGEFPLLSSPFVRFQLEAFQERLVLCGRVADASDWLFERLKPTVCLQGIDAYGPAKTWGRMARRSGAKTVTFLHGELAPHFHKYDRLTSETDLLVVRSDYDREAMFALGKTSDDLFVHRPEPLFGLHSDSSDENDEILLLTALSSYGFYNPMASPEQMWRDWEELRAMMERHSEWTFLIKPHPRYDHFDFYEEIELPENCCFDREAPLDEALNRARVAVMMDYPSSVILDSLQRGIPSVFLPGTWPIPELRTALDSPRIIKPDDVDGLEETLSVLMVTGPERTRAIEEGFAFLSEFYGTDTPGSPSLIERIEAVFSASEIHNPEEVA